MTAAAGDGGGGASDIYVNACKCIRDLILSETKGDGRGREGGRPGGRGELRN
eukprot:evm.model.NODE_25352_length_2023_cov_24.522491.1